MKSLARWAIVGAMLASGTLRADDLSAPVSLDARWWNEHELGWRLGPTTTVLDTATSTLADLRFEGAPDLPHNYNRDPAAYDPVGGNLLRFVIGGKYAGKPDLEGLWLFDAAGGKARKSAAGHPEGKHGGGNAMAYDALNREILLFLSSGAWRYDREKDAWEKVGDGGPVYVVDFDPQHNVFLASVGPGTLAAFRFKNVPAGTAAFYGIP